MKRVKQLLVFLCVACLIVGSLGTVDLTVLADETKPADYLQEDSQMAEMPAGEGSEDISQETETTPDISGNEESTEVSEASDVVTEESSDIQEESGTDPAAEDPVLENDPARAGSFVLQNDILSSDGHTYRVTVSDPLDAGIPADTELLVREIENTELKEVDPYADIPEKLKTDEIKKAESQDAHYNDYVEKAAEVLKEKPEDLSFARAFDITLRNPETKEEYQPNQNVNVSIQLIDVAMEKDAKIDIVHFDEESGKKELEIAKTKEQYAKPEQKEAAAKAVEKAELLAEIGKPEIIESKTEQDKVTFDTDGFSVYVVVTKTLEQFLEASDGNTYRISATYDYLANIPKDAQLVAAELHEGDEGYQTYLEQSLIAAGTTEASLDFAKAFDIYFLDPATGEHIHPGKDVKIDIELWDTDLSASEKINIVHFGEQNEVVDHAVNGGSLEFQTDSFSVYMVVGYTVDFHWGEYTYRMDGDKEIYLSELLNIIGNSVAESMTEDSGKLLALAADMYQIANVSFSNPELLKIEQKSSEQSENDWLLTSLAAFETAELLTIALTDGSEIVIHVTDEVAAGSVCKIDDTGYASLEDAIKAAPVGESTIELLTDIAIGKTIVLYGSNGNANNNRVDAKNKTITITTAAEYSGLGAIAVISRLSGFKNGTLIDIYESTTTLKLENVVVDGGGITTSIDGALMKVTNGSLVLNDGAVLQNGVTNQNGGGICLNNASLTMNGGSVIQQCTAQGNDGKGGGVFINGPRAVFIMEGGTIQNCEAQRNTFFAGGGVCLYDGNFTMNDGIIRNCHATAPAGNGWNGGWGGGLAVNHGKAAFINGGLITGCTATKGGAAVECHEDLYMTGGTITANHGGTANGISGAVNFYDTGSRLFVHGSPKIYGNYDVNGNYNDVAIRSNGGNITVDGDMNEDAIIGVNKEGTFNPDEQFGKYTPETIPANLNVFFADTDDTLVGMGFKYSNDANHGRWLIWARGIKVVAKMYTDDPSDAIEIKGSRGSFTTIGDFDGVSESERTITLTIAEAERQYRTTKGYGDYLSLVDSSSSFQFARKEGGTDDSVTFLRSKLTRRGTVRTFYNYYSLSESSVSNPNLINQNQFIELDVGDTITFYYKVSPKVKITNADGNILSADPFGNPALFGKLENAFSHLSEIYAKNGENYTNFSDPMHIKMLVSEYAMEEGAEASGNYDITLTTAGTEDTEFPGPGGSSVIKNQNVTYKSMISTALTSLTLDQVRLDGANKTTSADGALIKVNKLGAALTINDGASLQNGRTSGKGGAVFVADGAVMTMNGGSITGNYSEQGGAVNVGGTSSRLNFSGNAVVSKNKGGSGENIELRNVVLDRDTADIIRTVGCGLGIGAGIGIYVEGNEDDEDGLYAKRGKDGKVFGTYDSGADINLHSFVNDRNSCMAEKGENAGEIRWVKNDNIARVRSNAGEWKYFEYLINGGMDGNNDPLGAFNYANTLTGDVIIETLKETAVIEGSDRYTLSQGFTFNKAGMKSLTIRTMYGLDFDRSILTKNHNNSMITFSIANARLTVEDLILIGNGQNCTTNGGAINQTGGNAIILNRVQFGALKAGSEGKSKFELAKEDVDTGKAFCSAQNGGSVNTCVQASEISVTDCVFYGGKSVHGSCFNIDKGNNTNRQTTVAGCVFIGGETSQYAAFNEGPGGGMKSLSMKFDDCVFTDLTAGAWSGAILSRAVNTEIKNSTFRRCTAKTQTGGAVYAGNNGSGDIVRLESSDFHDCKAMAGAGGAVIINASNTQTYITDCSFENCSAAGKGGAVYAGGSLSMDNNEGVISFSNCWTTGSSDHEGGALFIAGSFSAENNSGAISFTNCHTEGTSCQGGAIYYGAKFVLKNTGEGTAAFYNCYTTGTGSDGSGGGAICTWGNNTMEIEGTAENPITFKKCTVKSGGGGAIWQNSGSSMKLTNVSFGEKNEESMACNAPGAGGAVRSNGSLTYTNSSNKEIGFYYSKTTGSEGGAFHSGGAVNVVNSNGGTIVFEHCTSVADGGAISINGQNLTINNTGNILFNFCYGVTGGAICTHQNVDTTVTNSGSIRFISCTAGKAGAVWTGYFKAENNSGEIHFEDCTASNTNEENGGAVYAGRGFILQNTAAGRADFINCSAVKNGGAIQVKAAYSGDGNIIITTENTEYPISFVNCKSTTGHGGAICQVSGSSVALKNVVFGDPADPEKACTAKGVGGAVRSEGKLTYTNSANREIGVYYSTSGSTSGGFYVNKGGMELHNTGSGSIVFESCICGTASTGGAVYVADGDVVSSNSAGGSIQFKNCIAGTGTYGAGGLGAANGMVSFANEGTILFNNCTSTSSNANNYGGAGGVYARNGFSLTGSGSAAFTDCTAVNGWGGAIVSLGDVTLTNATITGSIAKNYGGAVYQNSSADKPKLFLDNCTITGNTATSASSQGGAVWSNAREVGIKTHLEISNNHLSGVASALINAAGMYLYPEDVHITVTSATDEAYWKTYDNFLSDGTTQSNLKMGIGAPGIDFKGIRNGGFTGKVGVVNPAVLDRWFGRSTSYQVCGEPLGDRGEQGKEVLNFVDDTNTYFAQYRGAPQTRLIWAPILGDYVCKITDSDGRLLYYDFGDGNGYQLAVFEQLSDAFGAFGEYAADPDHAFVTAETQGTTVTPVNIELFRGNNSANTYTQDMIIHVPDNVDVTLKTASATAPDDLYPGNGTVCTVQRGGFYGSMFVMHGEETDTSNFTVTNITLDGANKTSTFFSQNGGIIRADGENCTLSLEGGEQYDCTLQNSKTTKNGGAVYMTDGSFSMCDNAVITACSASGNGGGVYLKNASLTLKDGALINGCSAVNGGGVYTEGDVNISAKDVANPVQITKNSATSGNGGGICQNKDGVCSVLGAEFISNTASSNNGGGIFTKSTDAVFGVSAETGKVLFKTCSAKNGGGAFVHGSGSAASGEKAKFTNTEFKGCTTGQSGAAIYSYTWDTELVNSTFGGEESSDGCSAGTVGGVIRFYNTATDNKLTITSCTATNCKSGTEGGAVYYSNILDMKDTDIVGCTSGSSGGALFQPEGEGKGLTTLSNCNFNGCKAGATGLGGAMYLSGSAILDSTRISLCEAFSGGAVYTVNKTDHSLTLKNGTQVTDNKLNSNAGARIQAAGVYMPDGGRIIFGASDLDTDSIAIKENYTQQGEPSNLRLSMTDELRDSAKSVCVLSELTEEIHIVNPGINNTQFGEENPGRNYDVPVIFVSDLSNHTAERRSGNQLWWVGEYVCKITDADRNTLNVGGTDAVYCSLKEAFDDFNTNYSNFKYESASAVPANIEIFRPLTDQEGYEGTDVYVMETGVKVPGRIITLRTADPDAAQYPYTGGDDYCTVLRGNTQRGSSMFALGNKECNLTFEDIIIDGQADKSQFACVKGGAAQLSVSGAKLTIAATGTVRNAAVSENGSTNQNGGGVSLANGAKLFIDPRTEAQGAAIIECIADGGGGGVNNENSGTFDISNWKIEGCSAANGGGMYNSAAVTLTNDTGTVLFQTCSATNGGGIYGNKAITLNSSLTEEESFVFERCSAVTGGGLYGINEVTLAKGEDASTVLFRNCEASANGGGVCSVRTFTANQHPVFLNCKAGTNGGGVYLPSEHNFYRHSITGGMTFTNCTAENGSGGGLYCYSDDNNSWGRGLTIGGSITFKDCTAGNSGGGMYKGLGNASYGYLTINANSMITAKNCHATKNDGGGLYTACVVNIGEGTKILLGSENENDSCSAGRHGGGWYSSSERINAFAQGIEFSAIKCVAGADGGGIYTAGLDGSGADFTLKKCVAGSNGGGIYSAGILTAGKSFTATECSATSGSGGGACIYGTLTANNNPVFTNCTAGAHGGGLALPSQHNYTRHYMNSGAVFYNCKAKNGDGGGLYCYSDDDNSWGRGLTLGGEISLLDCTAGRSGGGMYKGRGNSGYGHLTLNQNSSVIAKNCHAGSGHGGGIYTDCLINLQKGVSILIGGEAAKESCTAGGSGGGFYNGYIGINATAGDIIFSVVKCTAGSNGGGAYVCSLNATGADVTITDCTAGNSGGGILANEYLTAGEVFKITNCTATGGAGGGVYVAQTFTANYGPVITNCTASGNGGGVCLPSQHNFYRHSITGGAKFTNCVSMNGSGGGLFSYSDDDNSWGRGLTLGGSITFSNCSAEKSGGGLFKGLGRADYGYLTINEGNTIIAKNCHANSGSGGALYLLSVVNIGKKVSLKLGSSDPAKGCSAGTHGGGLYSQQAINATAGDVTINVENCEAKGGAGGGIFTGGSFTGTTDTCNLKWKNCSAKTHGGGVYAVGTVNLTYSSAAKGQLSEYCCEFRKCKAGGNGGAIFIDGSERSSSTLSGIKDYPVLILDCMAAYGSGIYVTNGRYNDYIRRLTLKGGFDAAPESAEGEDGEEAAQTNEDVYAGIIITGNKSTNTNGGAINFGGWSNRLDLEGNVLVSNNKNTDDGKARNVVLSLDSAGIITVLSKGIGKTAFIGIYTTTGTPDNNRGNQEQNFATLEKTSFTENEVVLLQQTLKNFVNDRRNLVGEPNLENSSHLVRWSAGYVCKLTDGNNILLYRDKYACTPAVYSTLKAGMTAASGKLYRGFNQEYIPTEPIKLKLLCDVQLGKDKKNANETATFSGAARDLTITTSEPVDEAIDAYPYTSSRTDHNNTALISTRSDKPLTNSVFVISDTRSYQVYDHTETRTKQKPVYVKKKKQQVDAEGNPVVDAEGNPVYETDAEGNPVYETDSEGNPVYETDEQGKPVQEVDSEGNPVFEVEYYDVEINRTQTDLGNVTVTKLIMDGENQNCGSVNGGAIRLNNAGKLMLDDVTFRNFTAANGGAIYIPGSMDIASSGTVLFKDCTSTAYGTAGEPGGGAINVHGIMNLNNAGDLTFDGCRASGCQGGAINVYGIRNDYKQTIQITNTGNMAFNNCSSAHDAGALGVQENHLSIDNSGNIRFTDCTVNNQEGGAINIDAGTLSISNKADAVISFMRCKAPSSGSYHGRGGAINAGSLIANDNHGQILFEACEAREEGGAIFISSGDGQLDVSAKTENGFVIKDCLSAVNGGGIYSCGNAAVRAYADGAVSMIGNSSTGGLGGAVFVPNDKALTLNGGNAGVGIEISGCSAGGTNGGAINAGNGNSRLYFGGNVIVYDNLASGSQRNVVLAQDSNAVIQTISGGLGNDARIGVFAVGEDNAGSVYGKHGKYQKDFGTYAAAETNEEGNVTKPDGTANLRCFTNDRNGLYGEVCTDHLSNRYIRWQSYLVKLTDGSGNLLYLDNRGRKPAVFDTLTEAFLAAKSLKANGTDVLNLYQAPAGDAAGEEYVNAEDTEIRAELLKNYIQPGNDRPVDTVNRPITLTTADQIADSSDVYVFYPESEGGSDPNRATILRGENGTDAFGNAIPDASMITLSSGSKELTLTAVILDGNFTMYQPAVNGGIVNAGSGTLHIAENASLRNSVLGTAATGEGESQVTAVYNGGAVYVGNGAKMTMNAGTLTGNTSSGNGGGIYLEEGAELQLSGTPGFGTDGNRLASSGLRQDIYIAGYFGTEADGVTPRIARSLVVADVLNCVKGSIWVGAEQRANEENNHYESLKQFAVFADSLMNPDGTLKLTPAQLEAVFGAFQNAYDSQYFAAAGDNIQCIYWDGVKGERKVILRKVEEGSYRSVEGAGFTVYSGDSTVAYEVKKEGQMPVSLTNLPSSTSGVFWIGTLPYGTYYIQETLVPEGYLGNKTTEGRWFYLIVDGDTSVQTGGAGNFLTGYATRAEAKAACEAEMNGN